MLIDEEVDSIKLIGLYSTEDSLRSATSRTRLLEGFLDEPDCFYYAPCTLDEDAWTDGYVRVWGRNDAVVGGPE